MDVRSLLRWPLRLLSGRARKWAYARLRPWLAKRGPYVANCSGIRMEIDLNEHRAHRYFLRGKVEPRIQDVLLPLLTPGMTFFDVGSHWGYYALLAAKAVGREGRSVAFEPEPGNLAFIRRNLSLNPGLNVIVEPLAVSDTEGEAVFRPSEKTDQGSIMEGSWVSAGAPFAVQTVSLDHYLDDRGVDRVDVMKMDIEGAEVQAFEGMAEGLKAGRYGHIVLEWHGTLHEGLGDRPLRALELLVSSGYELSAVRRGGALEPFSPELMGLRTLPVLCGQQS